MDFLRRTWAQVHAQLRQLTGSQKWLIGALVAVLILVLILSAAYNAQPEVVPLTAFAADRQAEVLQKLKGSGINAQTQNGRIVVPRAQEEEAWAVLAQNELMSGDASAEFDIFLKSQSPWQSNAQNAQAYMLAKQKALGKVIARMVGVRSASVMLAMPDNNGFGRSRVRPSASVNLVMAANHPVEKNLVAAVAGLISGAVAEMTPQDVVVIDANRGRQYTVKSAEEAGSSELLEYVNQIEQYHQKKIADLLTYIPGVIVAVNVRIDAVQAKQVEKTEYEPSEPLKSTYTKETERKETSAGGEPGAGSNTGIDINGGATPGSSDKTTEERNEYGEKAVASRTTMREAGQLPKQISVTVNVPHSYFVGLFKAGKPADPAKPAAEPDDAALKPIVDAQLAQIQSQVAPLISTDVPGEVRVTMVPDAGAIIAMNNPGAGTSGGGVEAVGAVLTAGWVKPAFLGVLALASLALMFGMVRKATQMPPMPSIEELAGVPPIIQTEEDDLVGEADAMDPSMAGVELDEVDLRHRKIAEQIGEMVKGNPTEAATLFNRWVRKEH